MRRGGGGGSTANLRINLKGNVTFEHPPRATGNEAVFVQLQSYLSSGKNQTNIADALSKLNSRRQLDKGEGRDCVSSMEENRAGPLSAKGPASSL